jgi:hypothetical protein
LRGHWSLDQEQFHGKYSLWLSYFAHAHPLSSHPIKENTVTATPTPSPIPLAEAPLEKPLRRDLNSKNWGPVALVLDALSSLDSGMQSGLKQEDVRRSLTAESDTINNKRGPSFEKAFAKAHHLLPNLVTEEKKT